jgi:hypothetical protein
MRKRPKVSRRKAVCLYDFFAWVILCLIPIAGLYFWFNDRVSPRSEPAAVVDAAGLIPILRESPAEPAASTQPEPVEEPVAPTVDLSCSSFLSQELCDCCGIFRIDAGYAFGQYIGQWDDYGTLGLLLAPAPLSGNWFPLLDLRGYRLEHEQWAASVGLGARFLTCDRIWGINAYYDYRQTRLSHFNRVGVGLESLGNYWDWRINGYFPAGHITNRTTKHHYNDYIGDFHSSCQMQELGYSGFDAEVGVPIGCNCRDSCSWARDIWLYAAAGPYYYTHHHWRHFWGGAGRIELNYDQWLSFQVRASYDHHYKGRVQGLVQLTLPLDDLLCGRCCESVCRPACKEPIQRNGLQFYDKCCDWDWNWDDTLPNP